MANVKTYEINPKNSVASGYRSVKAISFLRVLHADLIISEWRTRLQLEAAAKLAEIQRLRLVEATHEGSQLPLISTLR